MTIIQIIILVIYTIAIVFTIYVQNCTEKTLHRMIERDEQNLKQLKARIQRQQRQQQRRLKGV